MALLLLPQRNCRPPGYTFAVVSNGETASVTFAWHWSKIEAQPLNFPDFRNVGKLDLHLDLNFSFSEKNKLTAVWKHIFCA